MMAAGLQRKRAPVMLFFSSCWSEGVTVFSPKNERSKISAHLGSVSLTATSQARNLGVIIDSDLNFNNHLKFVSKYAFYA